MTTSPLRPNRRSARTTIGRAYQLVGALLLGILTAVEAAPVRTVRVGVVDSAEPGFYASTVEPTLRAIERTLPNARTETVRLSSVTLLSDIRLRNPDLFIAPAADFLRVVDAVGAHPIATRKTTSAANPANSVGAAVVVRANREDLTTLADLKGLRAAATLPTALDGWLAARMTLETAGLNSKTFFGDVHFMSYGIPHVVSAVLSGEFDAGVLPTCQLERAEAEGLVAKGTLRVLSLTEHDPKAERGDELLACRRSTELYPDWVAGALPGIDPELARRLTIALLTPERSPDPQGTPEYVWQVTSDFHTVRELERTLKLGQWSYLESWTPEALWMRFRWYVLGAALALLLLALNEWRLRSLVRRRTAELQAALREKDRLDRAERAARKRLSDLERMGTVSQLCAMIAHELKQPVGAVINYMAVLRLKTGLAPTPGPKTGKPADPILERALTGAETEAKRIAEIVDRVRGYAKRRGRETVRVDLAAQIEAAVSGALRTPGPEVRFIPEQGVPMGKGALVAGDPLELELLFLNLIKNAREAAAGRSTASDDGVTSPDPCVEVRLTAGPVEAEAMSDSSDRPLPALSETALRVLIRDNGPKLSDEAYARLMTVSESVKAEGLGLGLAIVRNIVDEHGARLSIRRLPVRGLEVAVDFERWRDEESERNQHTEKEDNA